MLQSPGWLVQAAPAPALTQRDEEMEVKAQAKRKRGAELVAAAKEKSKANGTQLEGEVVNLLLKVVLKHEMAIRDITGALWHTFVCVRGQARGRGRRQGPRRLRRPTTRR